jgi:hypothetical protein
MVRVLETPAEKAHGAVRPPGMSRMSGSVAAPETPGKLAEIKG